MSKNFLVVGASKGIGAALVQHILKENKDATVYTISRSEVDIPNSINHHHLVADVLNDDISSFIPAELSGLAYCPGSINLKPFHRLTEADFQKDWQINFYGAVKVIQQSIKSLKQSKDASVVLFSTVAAQTGMPFHSSIAGAKAAVEGLTKSLAAEYAMNNIRFNAIAPSITQTSLAAHLLSDEKRQEAAAQRHPLKRIGSAEDMATMAYFLLNNSNTWITGQILRIDGGMSTLKLI